MRTKFENLVNAWSVDPDDADLLDMIQDNMNAFMRYVESVYMMETQMKIIRVRYEGEEYRDKVQALDQRRRIAHERAITAVKQLNRWSLMKDLPKFYEGDEEDRYQVADFCEEVVRVFFQSRMGNKTIAELLGGETSEQ